jgi:hypothetical protein
MSNTIIDTAELTTNQRRLLAAVSVAGCLTRAAEAAEVARSQHYEWLKQSEAYATAYHAAQIEAADLLESEARRRAVDGTKRLKFHLGKPILDPETGEPYFEHEYSDVLLIFLLKGLKPEKFRERSQVEFDATMRTEGVVNLYLPDNGRRDGPDDETEPDASLSVPQNSEE